jgi:hypothetical protein
VVTAGTIWKANTPCSLYLHEEVGLAGMSGTTGLDDVAQKEGVQWL